MKGVIGIGLEISGRAAYPRFAAEEGLHIVQTSKQTTRALVSTSDAAMTEYQPPEGIERAGAIAGHPRRRHYRPEQGTVDDERLGTVAGPFKSVAEALSVLHRGGGCGGPPARCCHREADHSSVRRGRPDARAACSNSLSVRCSSQVRCSTRSWNGPCT